ncbi:MAG: hypothetical protein JTT15_01645 [Candidatus Brockarchaeota archaeon]|nr:hypothetical protein [Candidatus Brockarchaeota archaeon]
MDELKEIVDKIKKRGGPPKATKRQKKDLIKYIEEHYNLLPQEEIMILKDRIQKKISEKPRRGRAAEYEVIHSDLSRIIELLTEIKDMIKITINNIPYIVKPDICSLIPIDKFKVTIDNAIASTMSNVGWAQLSEVESKVSSELKLNHDQFEELFRIFIDKYGDLYELAPGGTRQFVIKGKYYGLIRKK